ncbi:unnamed protein product [Notodromas monacha]|uniref:Uncharacterized protein n=1 Tax=Notodromas monacha TaxID=399045 RepID=A0A7R9BEI3_9CRUS|nr:unnamed protein product [Notodromas monacha]CAG0913901.1 unnamed protein product [Notodromas monacha]
MAFYVNRSRLLELKQELMRLECNEVINLADMLSAMKLQPNAVELRIPPFFVRHRKVMLDERRQQFTEIYKKLGYIEEEATVFCDKSTKFVASLGPFLLILGLTTLLTLLGRLGWDTVGLGPTARPRTRLRQKSKPGGEDTSSERRRGVEAPEEPGDEGSNFEDGKRITAPGSQQANKLVDPGKSSGTDPSKSRASQESEARWRQIKEERYRLQLQHESNYRVALVELMSELRETEGPLMSEAFQKEIKEWFLEMKEKEGRLPDLPTEEEGGSISGSAQ